MSISKTKLEKINITCVNQNLKKFSRTIALIYDRKLSINNITINQFAILSYIAYYDNITLGSVAIKLSMDRSTLSKNLKPLFREKYIIVTGMDDKRKKNLSLTQKGLGVLEQSIISWKEAQNDIYRQYGKKEIHNLVRMLHGLIDINRER